MLVKMGSSSLNRDENKKYLKPPPSFGHVHFFLPTRFHQCMIPKLPDHTSPAQKYWDPHDSLHSTNTASNQDGSVAIEPAKPWFKGEKR